MTHKISTFLLHIICAYLHACGQNDRRCRSSVLLTVDLVVNMVLILVLSVRCPTQAELVVINVDMGTFDVFKDYTQ